MENNISTTYNYDLLTQGSYLRVNDDLVIELGEQTEIINNYFINPTDLTTEKGATIEKHIVQILSKNNSNWTSSS